MRNDLVRGIHLVQTPLTGESSRVTQYDWRNRTVFRRFESYEKDEAIIADGADYSG